MSILAGAASAVITPELGVQIQGAGHPNQPARTIRDELEANAVLLSDGAESVLLVSCDLAGLTSDFVARARAEMAEASGLSERSVIITCTHTHSGPSVLATNYKKPVDFAWLECFRGQLIDLARAARKAVRPALIGWGLGSALIGYNRRCCWADGSHTMFNPAGRDDFTGLEGPDDSAHLALFVCDEDDKPLAVIHNNTSHPTCFYGGDCFSADFPGVARAYVRESLGNVPVLYLNGAFGDISRTQMPRKDQLETPEQCLLRLSHLVAGETLRLFYETTFHEDLSIAHLYEDISMPVQLPHPDRLAWARGVLGQIDAGEDVRGMEGIMAWGIASLQDTFGNNPTDTLAVHVIRIGDVALITQPCELYCRFGLDVKRRSPAPLTAVCSLADGYGGYCPTMYGILGGGYSGEPISWRRFAPETGYRIVDAACRMLYSLWPNGSLE